jgi:hypothetical protein
MCPRHHVSSLDITVRSTARNVGLTARTLHFAVFETHFTSLQVRSLPLEVVSPSYFSKRKNAE